MKTVCFICDDNYVMPTSIAIQSFVENTLEEYHIVVLGVGMSEECAELLKQLATDRVKIDVIESGLIDRFKDVTSKNPHVSNAALVKFLIADMLTECDDVLYMDGDILVEKDVSKIWEYKTDKYAVVVKDMRAIYTNNADSKYVAFNNSEYFNSGVMLLNTRKIRNGGIAEKLIDARLSKERFFMDQDTFNEVFEGMVDYMPITYNGMYSTLSYFATKEIASFYGISLPDSTEDVFRQMAIIHFCSPTKPWKYYDSWYADNWYEYYLRSPFGNKKLNRERWKK